MKLPGAFSGKGTVNVIVETPKGNRNKYDFDFRNQLFYLRKVLPAGMAFPFDFGFIPNTKAPDGDPLDVAILTDEPSFTGCLIECRLLGVIEAIQREFITGPRNDRLLAVSVSNTDFNLKSIEDISKKQIEEFIGFFTYYNKMEGKKFKALGVKGEEAALKLIRNSMGT